MSPMDQRFLQVAIEEPAMFRGIGGDSGPLCPACGKALGNHMRPQAALRCGNLTERQFREGDASATRADPKPLKSPSARSTA
jgi:hypothetical protein